MDTVRGKKPVFRSFSFSSLPAWWGAAVKRGFDIAASAVGLLLLSPLFLLVALWIKREGPGPVFYRGPRLGRGGKPFGILKFRTMREERASYEGPSVTAQDDPRVTPLGHWLRNTKLNELPQLWNVLAGEMSLVGPRPEDPEIAKTWPAGAYREILSVRPGMTSPASVAYHDEERQLSASHVMDEYMQNIVPDKLRLDLLYVRHHTFLTDLDALFWTFIILVPRLGEHRISEGWLFGGPLTRFVRRFVSWTTIDFLAAFASISLVGVIWRLGGPLNLGWWPSLQLAVLLALLFGFCNTLLGLKTVVWSRAAAEDTLRLLVSCGLVTWVLVFAQALVATEHDIPASFLYTAGVVVLLSFIAVRYRLRLVTGLASRWVSARGRGYGAGERVLVVGAGQGGEFASWLLRRPDFRGLYSVIGIVDDDPKKQGMRFDGIQVLGTTADIPELVHSHDVGVIFQAISHLPEPDRERILALCQRTKCHVILLSDVLWSLHASLTQDPRQCDPACPYLAGTQDYMNIASPGLERKDSRV